MARGEQGWLLGLMPEKLLLLLDQSWLRATCLQPRSPGVGRVGAGVSPRGIAQSILLLRVLGASPRWVAIPVSGTLSG